MATVKWVAPEARTSYFTTELTNLANAAFTAAGAVITNETGATGLYQYIDFEMVLTPLTPTAGAAINIWALYTLDGTNYNDASKPLQTSALLTSIQLDTAASTAQRVIWTNVVLGPLDFKLQVENKSGVTLGAGGNSLNYRRHYEQVS